MSRTLTRSPLTAIAMNGAGTRRKRRSARLSGENDGEEGGERGTGEEGKVGAGEGQIAKKMKMAGGGTMTTSKAGTKERDGDSNKLVAKGRGYDETVDGFSFRRGRSRRGKEPEQVVQTAEPPPVVRQASPEANPARTAKPAAVDGKAKVRTANKVYSEKVDDFAFNKGRGRRGKVAHAPTVENSSAHESAPPADPSPMRETTREITPLPTTTEKGNRRPASDTPERAATQKQTRRSKRSSRENESELQASPQRTAHATSHSNTARSPSPQLKARPVTVEKKRTRTADGIEAEEKTMRIHLPFQDTPVIRRNKEMRKNSGDGHRRSSTGLRGRRVSSLIDEGRGNGEQKIRFFLFDLTVSPPTAVDWFRTRAGREYGADRLIATPISHHKSTTPFQSRELVHDILADETITYPALPHTEVPTAEFFKHISADLTEPRRMRCLLGWCGARALPSKPDAPKDNSPAASLEFQASQADSLSNWFGRDEQTPTQIPLRRKANPRNFANAAKAVELEQELERLKQDKTEWETLIKSATSAVTPVSPSLASPEDQRRLSPIRADLLDSPQRAILANFQSTTSVDGPSAPADLGALQTQMQDLSTNLEFSVDQFAHGVHALTTAKTTADSVADRTLAETAAVLDHRAQAYSGKGADAVDSLRALGKLLNGKLR
nr:kinetochore protein mis13 [Quercus suber]